MLTPVNILGIMAKSLCVQPPALESTLAYKTKLVKKELCIIFLDPDGASDSRDDLTKTLLSSLHLVEQTHQPAPLL